MNTRRLSLLFLGAALAACATDQAPKSTKNFAHPIETLVSYPHGAFLENLTVAPDLTVFFTSYFDNAVIALAPDGTSRVFAQLEAHPVGIVRMHDGFIATAHRIPFTQVPAFLSSNEILLIGFDGVVKKTIPAPDARFLNGLAQVGPDKVLIADSVAGCIWALTPSTGDLKIWLRDLSLAQDTASKEFRPGANGLKVHEDMLYISNSSRGALYRVPLNASGDPIGAPTLFVQPGPIDDFVITPTGVFYASTHGDRLLRIAADGTVASVLESGCDSCTSVALARRHNRDQLIVLTTGNFIEGGATPARVLALDQPK